MRINFIGAGRVGQTLARLISQRNVADIGQIINRTLNSTLHAIEVIGQGLPCTTLTTLSPADITFITTSDQHILEIANSLSQLGSIKPGSVVLHCSGILSSELLAGLKQHHCFIASVHPLRSFVDPIQSADDFNGTFCIDEGDPEAIAILRPLFESLGGRMLSIQSTQKALYHTAAVFASNYVVTLAEQAFQCLSSAGMTPDDSMALITTLMQTTLSNLNQSTEPSQALTGPIQRGDAQTIQQHLNALPPTHRQLYQALGQATLALTSLDKTSHTHIKSVLCGSPGSSRAKRGTK